MPCPQQGGAGAVRVEVMRLVALSETMARHAHHKVTVRNHKATSSLSAGMPSCGSHRSSPSRGPATLSPLRKVLAITFGRGPPTI